VSREFIAEIGEEVRANLARSVDAIGLHEVDRAALAVRVAGEALVIGILLAVFGGIYLALSALFRLALRRWVPAPMLRPLRLALRYLVGLGFLLALMAQWDASSEVLEATARGGLIAFGFYAAWVVVVRLMQRTLERNEVDPSVAQLSRNALGDFQSGGLFRGENLACRHLGRHDGTRSGSRRKERH